MKKYNLNFCFTLLFISIVCLNTSAQTASFDNIWVEHNVKHKGYPMMHVHSKIHINDSKDKPVDLTLKVFDSNGRELNNKCHVKKTLTPGYVKSVYKDYVLILGNVHLDFPYATYNKKCYFIMELRDQTSKLLARSEPYYFIGSRAAHPDSKRTPEGHMAYNFDPIPDCLTSDLSSSNKNTDRVSNANGAYADKTTNADGTITSVNYSQCNICNGMKACKLCSGTGGVWGGHGKYRRYAICTSCGGSGKCKYCGGTGVTVLTTTYDPKTNSSVGRDLHTGNQYFSGGTGGDNDRPNNSNSSNGTKSSCSICHGTGIDPFAWESGSSKPAVGGYTHSSGSKCQYCGKYEWHQHVYCPKCNANKYP